MQDQQAIESNQKRLGPPPTDQTQQHPASQPPSRRTGLSQGEIAVGLGIAFGFVVLGIFFNIVRH